MKSIVVVAALAASANALVGRGNGCCFHLSVTGDVSGSLGQIGDGQSRVGDSSLPPSQFCINLDGGITDSSGRGCIITNETTQFQCDEGSNGTIGFSVSSSGQLEYHGNPAFIACETGQNGGRNVYTTNSTSVTMCKNIQMKADTCAGSGASGQSPATTTVMSTVTVTGSCHCTDTSGPATAPAPGASGTPSPAPAPGGISGAGGGGSGGQPSGPGGGGGGNQPSGGGGTGGGGGNQPSGGGGNGGGGNQPSGGGGTGGGGNQPSGGGGNGGGGNQPSGGGGGGGSPPLIPIIGGGGAPPSVPSGGTHPSGQPSGGHPPGPSSTPGSPGSGGGGRGGGSQPSGGPRPSSPGPSSTGPSSTGPSSTGHSSTGPSSTGPSNTNPSSTGPSSTGRPSHTTIPVAVPSTSSVVVPSFVPSANSSSTSTKPSSTQSSGGACVTTLAKDKSNYQYPHLVVPINSSSPDTSYGTQYFATISSLSSILFNFDIPDSYSGKTCNLVFLFPQKADLETSDYTFNGDGKIDISELTSTATSSTTYHNAPSVSHDLGDITISPGNSYVVNTFSCPSGKSLGYQIKNAGSTYLHFFEDWNPSPLGLYITAC